MKGVEFERRPAKPPHLASTTMQAVPPTELSLPRSFECNTKNPTSTISEDKIFSLSLPALPSSAGQIEEANELVALSEVQVTSCNKVILDEQTRIMALRRQILNSERTITLAKRSIIDLEATILEYHSSRTPTVPSRIPAEVLGEIFQYYISDLHCSPWTLTQICRVWRQIAFNTPRLWGGIVINPGTSIGGARYRQGREICVTSGHLHRALQRAKQAPLYLTMYGHPCKRPSEDELVTTRGDPGLDLRVRMWEMMEMIGTRMRQWRSLNIAFAWGMDWQGYWERCGSLENLHALSMLVTHPPLLRLVERTSHKLRSLSLPGNESPEWRSFKGFGRLEKLCLSGTGDYNNHYHNSFISRDTAMPILNIAPRLKQLRIALLREDNHLDSPDMFPTGLIDLRIRSSIMEWRTFLSPSSQSLAYLEINQSSYTPTVIQGSIELPILNHLKIYGNFALAGLTMLVCPQLNTLELLSCGNDKQTEISLKQLQTYIAQRILELKLNPFPVQRLALYDISFTSSLLRQLLSQFAGVKELSIKCESLSKPCFTGFAATRKEGGAKTLALCPNLRRVMFQMTKSGASGGLVMDWKELIPIFKDIVKARIRMKSPLEIFQVPGLDAVDPITAVAAEGIF